MQDDLYMTVLRLKDCRLGNTGAVSLAEYITSFVSASLVELDLETSMRSGGTGREAAPQNNPYVAQLKYVG